MEPWLASAGLLAAVHVAAMLSPGPTAFLVLRTSADSSPMPPLVGGIVAATVTNVGLTIAGIAAIIAASTTLARAIALCGAIYLLYLGGRSLVTAVATLRARRAGASRETAQTAAVRLSVRSRLQLFREGYLVNLLNPKIAIFYVSIFSQVAAPGVPPVALALFGSQMTVQSLVFWSSFAALTRTGLAKRGLAAGKGWLDAVFGVALILFAIILGTGSL